MGNPNNPPKKNNKNAISRKGKILLFFFSLFVHLIAVLPFINMPIALDDMYQYDMLARSLSSGLGYRWYSKADVEVLAPYLKNYLPLEETTFPEDGFRTAFRAPGYPFFLAFFYNMNSGDNRFIPVRIAQAVLLASLTLMVLDLSEAVGLSQKSAIIAGLLVSLYPILLFYPIALASENLFIPLFAWSVYIAWKVKEKPSSIWLYILLGVLLGMMVLTRSISFLILLFIIGWLFFSFKRGRIKSLIPLVIAMLFIVPWSIRNSVVMGHPAFVENSLWYNMYIGYHPEGSGNFESDIAIKPLFITDDAERDEFCKTQAIGFIKADPVEAMRRIFSRIPAFFGPETRAFNYFYGNNLLGPIPQPWIRLIYLMLTLPWFFICLFGTIGLIDSRNRPLAILVGLTSLVYFLPHLPIVTEPRFHLALVPLLAPFAIDAVTRKNRGNEMIRKGKRHWVIIAFIVIFFVAIWMLKIYEDLPLYLRLLAPGGNKIGLSY